MKIISKILTMLFLIFSLVVLTNPNIVNAAEEGITFEEYNRYVVNKPYEELPYTVEAEVKLPSGAWGTIFGNFDWTVASNNVGHARSWLLDIQGGNIRLLYTNKDYAEVNKTFTGVNVCTNEWMHLAVTIDAAANKAHLYINGELQSSIDINKDMTPLIGTTSFHVGGDNRTLNTNYLRGSIRELNVYSDLRTADEVKADYTNGVNLNDGNLIAQYNLSSSNTHKNITDNSGNGFDVIYQDFLYDNQEISLDYTHSFAVVGDTQMLNYWGMSADGTNTNDLTTTTNNMNKLYKWIVDNKEEHKIEHVFGLGDITETWAKKEGSVQEGEWPKAKNAIYQMNGIVSYNLTRGNHDESSFMNKYFNEPTYRDQFDGFYGETINTSYKTLKVGNIDYLMITLDFGASDGELAWANSVVAAHPNHKVIVTTHGYLEQEGNRMEDYPHVPHNTTDVDRDGDYNNGEQIWDKFISNHPNILLVMSGHIGSEEVVYNQSVGKHGNVVTEVLVDFQDVDKQLVSQKKADPAGVVVMLYLNEDASQFEVAAYSTIRNKYYRSVNHFSVDLNGSCDGQHSFETKYDVNQHWIECAGCGLACSHENHEYVVPSNSTSSVVEAVCECGATKEKSTTNNATALQLQALLERYYSNGIYIKDTNIYIDPSKVGEELASYFHANVSILDRKTYYDKNTLWMSAGTGFSGYGTSADGKNLISFKSNEPGVIGVETLHSSLPGMEDYYCTLLDFILGEHTSAHSNNISLDLVSGWTYENGVYTNTNPDVLDAFRLFTAPAWLNKNATTKNYMDYTHATIEVINGELVMKLWVSATEVSGKLQGATEVVGDYAVFSKAVISEYYWDRKIENSLRGSGTEADPYLIERVSDLAYLKDQISKGHYFTGKYFKLVNDIDLAGENFMMDSFDGVFDGNGHAIKGLAIQNDELKTGLFRVLETNGVVKNLKVYGTITGVERVGAIAGELFGKIIGCENYAVVTGDTKVGGLFGHGSGESGAGTVTDSINYGEVRGYAQVGGIGGYTWGAITNSQNKGLVEGTNTTGGIIGLVEAATILKCVNNGTVGATSWNIGGIAGRSNESSKLVDCVNNGSVYSSSDAIGGIVGTAQGAVTNCTNAGSVEGKNNIGGIAGVTSAKSTINGSTGEKTATVKGASNVGGITGYAINSVNNCNNYSTVSATTGIVGGIVGMNPLDSSSKGQLLNISNCNNYGNVTGGNKAAGIIGQLYYGEVKNCTNEGVITGTNTVAGIVGATPWSTGRQIGDIKITSCTNKGTIHNSSYFGTGIGGALNYTVMTDCVNYGDVDGTGDCVGGIAAVIYNTSTITNCTNHGNLKAKTNIGGIIYDNQGIITNCYNYGSVKGTNASPATGPIYVTNTGTVTGCEVYNNNVVVNHLYLDGSVASAQEVLPYTLNTLQTINAKKINGYVASHDYVNVYGTGGEVVVNIYYSQVDVWDGVSVSTSLSGSGTQADPFLIQSGADLAYIKSVIDAVTGGKGVNYKTHVFKGQYFKMTKSIDLNGANFMIGYHNGWDEYQCFAGILDGNNCTIRGLNTAADKSSALFACIQKGGIVKNLSLYGTVTGTKGTGTGSLVAYLLGTAENITSYVTVSGVSTVGGIAGNAESNGSVLLNCVNYGNVTGSSYIIGGIAGSLGHNATGCVNYGKITGSSEVGGVGGSTKTTGAITYCTNYGDILSSSLRAGGIAGLLQEKMEHCVNYGNVTGTYNVGGVVGQGNVAEATVASCTNYGNVKGTTTHLGGVVGSTESSVADSVNYGNVSGGTWGSGGIAGYCKGNITNCTNNGNVSAIGQIGGIVGKLESATSKIENCVNNGAITGTSNSTVAGICGNVTIAGYTAELKTILETTNKNNGTSTGANIVGTITA